MFCKRCSGDLIDPVNPMVLSKNQKLSNVLGALTQSLESGEVRREVGRGLLDLLGADYFASYVWDQDSKQFSQRVILNMDPDNLDQYDAYFQFHDPITPILQKHRDAVPVRAVMDQRRLVNTEFYNDFLRNDGLYYGVNLYAYDQDNNIGDLRIWRARHRNDFDSQDLATLNFIKPLFVNVMRNIRDHQMLRHARATELNPLLLQQLTPRERDIVEALLEGLPDKLIARQLNISFSTVRTYINRLFGRFNVKNRTELIRLFLS